MMVEPAETMADDNKSIPEAIATNHAEVKHLLHTIALGTGRIEATRRSPASSARTERLERCGYVVPSHPCRLRSPPSRRGCASAASPAPTPAAPIKRRRISRAADLRPPQATRRLGVRWGSANCAIKTRSFGGSPRIWHSIAKYVRRAHRTVGGIRPPIVWAQTAGSRRSPKARTSWRA